MAGTRGQHLLSSTRCRRAATRFASNARATRPRVKRSTSRRALPSARRGCSIRRGDHAHASLAGCLIRVHGRAVCRADDSKSHAAPGTAGVRQSRLPPGIDRGTGGVARAPDRLRARAGLRAARLHLQRHGFDPAWRGRLQAGDSARAGTRARPDQDVVQGIERVPGRTHPGARDPAAARGQRHVHRRPGSRRRALHGDATGARRDSGGERPDVAQNRFDRRQWTGQHPLARPLAER